MVCPRCQRPLWREFVKNLYHPQSGEQRCRCRACENTSRYYVPDYLAEAPYLYFGGAVIAFTLLVALSLDEPLLVRVALVMSLLALYSGLIALLTWTKTRVRPQG